MGTWFDDAIREAFVGRDVIIAGAVPAAWTDHVDTLRRVGAGNLMIFAPEGAGISPGPDVPTVVLEPPTDLTSMERIRFGNDAIADPPEHVREALSEFDPARTATVVGSFLNESPELDGRRFLAHRRPEWVALEDKIVIDEFWDRAGVARLPFVVVPLPEASAVAATVDRGAGTVWAADARDGFHGGASNTHWVADDTTRERALERLSPTCDRVRIMPFVDGIPCSIHGIVLPDGVVALRPVEMVTLRCEHELVYAGCSTTWDPSEAVRCEMRSIAHRVGSQLARECAFRGFFTVDGVVERLTGGTIDAESFWPTELNPRVGAGVNVFARAGPTLPLMLVNDLIVADRSLGITATDLESELVAHCDEFRHGGTWRAASPTGEPTQDQPIVYDGNRWSRPPDDDVAADGRYSVGRSAVRCIFEPGRTPIGPSVGRRAAAFYEFSDAELGTEFGPLTPAPAPD